jgi:hypothetical protein
MLATGTSLLVCVLAVIFYARLVLAFNATTLPRDTGQRWRDIDTRVIDTIAAPGEPIWDVPLDPYEYLAAARPLATRYAFFLPWQGASPAITAQLLVDLDRSRPPVIIFRTDPDLLGRWSLDQYAPDVFEYVRSHYAPTDPTDPYWSAVFLRDDRADEYRARLRAVMLAPYSS